MGRTRTHDEPVGFSERNDGRTAVHISQVVRSLDGPVISKGQFLHLHCIEGRRIVRMDIEAHLVGPWLLSGIKPERSPVVTGYLRRTTRLGTGSVLRALTAAKQGKRGRSSVAR